MIYDKTEDERDEGAGTTSARLEDLGIDVRWVNRVMHHKYVIIDGVRTGLREASEATVVSGSGNWSYGAAAYYDENTVFLRGYPEVALRFQREFNLMWEYSRAYDHNEALERVDSMRIRPGMVLDREGVEATFTSQNFRTYVSSRWGPTFGVKDSPPTVANRITALMERADESIWVASGHLRSRPIAETLMRLHRERPELDIRVYLDGQEFISRSYHREQLDELETCLAEAADADDRRACRQSGWYFSYAVHDSGVPVRFKYYAYRWHYTYAKQMHHKYVIIDGETLVSGSYNFSNNAEFNTLENIVTYRRSQFPNLVDRFESNFLSIWETGRNGRLGELKQEIRTATERIPIVFEPMALTYSQVTELEELIEETCPAVTSEDYDEDPRNHEECVLDGGD
jgi:phosphatidylserine/phosphatidylglycerophosphate/cardiolipin synthase-like enzyme